MMCGFSVSLSLMMIPVQTVPTYGDDGGGADMFDPTMDGNTRSNAAVAVNLPAVAMDLQRSEITFARFPHFWLA